MRDPDDLTLLINAAREAGHIANQYFEAGDARSWTKDLGHPVTNADIEVNACLHKILQTARSDYGWLSEETQDDASRHSARRSFVVDPIDGTRAFIDGKPHFTISVAVTEDGQARAGVVYNPVLDELFASHKGGGAMLNNRPIQTSHCARIENCTMVGYPRKFRRLGWPDMNVTVRNSMAYRIVLVAAGMQDATVSFTFKSDWDLAAAGLIAEEAGAIITDLTGAPFLYNRQSIRKNGVICAGPALYPLILQKVSETAPEFEKELGTIMSDRKQETAGSQQLLHLVIGGELVDPMRTEFIDLSKVVFKGAYPNYKTAYDAWKSAAQQTVDNAHMRFFILHAHQLIDPDSDGVIG